MATCADVAAKILELRGPMSSMKLQKLVFYCQAWHLVWSDETLFEDEIQAWANGPVAPNLYQLHKGRFTLSEGDISGNPNDLTPDQADSVAKVVEFYGDKSAHWLSELTHSEAPWVDARNGLPPGVRSSNTILPASMAEYYGSL